MQHISADSMQTVVTEYGPFIKIGGFRVRRDQITGYQYRPRTNEAGQVEHFLYINCSGNVHSAAFVEVDSEEVALEEMEKLDVIFNKIYLTVKEKMSVVE